MKRILLVDDDALVKDLYRKALEAAGYSVQTAADGFEAIKAVKEVTPDFIVLDLMMPRMSGADVLKFIRSQPASANVPVVALTNAFMSEQARAVSALGVERGIIKGDCTPAKMVEIANQLLSEKSPAKPAAAVTDTSLVNNEARESFLRSAPNDFTDLKAVSREFSQDPSAAGRSGNLRDFFRQAHHLASAAALARCHHIALLCGVLEALLYELQERPQFITASTSRTVAAAVDFLGQLIQTAQSTRRPDPLVGEVLAVDDDPLANRIALAALSRAKLNARAVERPTQALELLATTKFDLVLLDVAMPEMNGFELCQKLRELPGYEHTPVIYVTSHADFENRARSLGTTGIDLIAKPVFPIELATKAVMHLIKGKLTAQAGASA